MNTQSIFRLFRRNSETPVSGSNEAPEYTQSGTSQTEVPVGIPTTESKVRSLLLPPNLLTEPRPAWTEMRDYAHHAPYLGGGHRWVREAGVWYWRLVALPMAALARIVEWVFERPTRLILAGGLVWWGVSLIVK
jgi:hypothetical protein